jgi:hypothetical protein
MSHSYVGEVGIWTGIWALSSASLQTIHYPRGTIALAAMSPLFTYFLLRYVRLYGFLRLSRTPDLYMLPGVRCPTARGLPYSLRFVLSVG